MGIFGFGQQQTPPPTPSNEEDMYSPSVGGSTLNDSLSFDDSQQQLNDKLPDFISSISYDVSRLQPAALQGGIDFLQVEDPQASALGGGASLTPSRGWTDDLCYGTGTTYLAGLALGGAYGLAEGLRKSASAPNSRIRINTTLNSITRRGPGLGNSVGVIAMMYNGVTAMIDATRGTHDVFSSIGGGALAGAIFKSTAGPRTAAISAAVCASATGIWSLLVSSWAGK